MFQFGFVERIRVNLQTEVKIKANKLNNLLKALSILEY